VANIRLVEYRGEKMTIAQAAVAAGIRYSTLWGNIAMGMSVQEAAAPAGERVKRYDVGAEQLTAEEMAQRSGVSLLTIVKRLRSGVSPEAAMRSVSPEAVDANEAPEAVMPRKGRRSDARVYDVGGEQLTVKQMSQRMGVPKSTILDRLRRGVRPEEAIKPIEKARSEPTEPVARLTWPEKAHAMVYPSAEREGMGFREASPGNWVWTTNYFNYMASRLGRDFVLLRAWWRDSGESAMVRLYRLKEEKAGDSLTEVSCTEMRRRILRRWGLE